ncbi:uncharacterized protein LOC119503947 isoform X1 [Sebastes umbrosus]|uniref:uncharacterized protein LOC119503947 isoform X1 n=2 Tax=Sebastes umbrosus TaxID=72105 RepID=UPI00189FD005|nr:uncharacterized protein LOC119503947 isoform X1 [Sebastes umbrosus]
MNAIGRILCVFCRKNRLHLIRNTQPTAAGLFCEAQSRSVMLHHQDQPLNSAYGGQGGSNHGSSSSLRNRRNDKDGNFNFLPGKDNNDVTGGGGGDENRNQVRPRNLGPLGRDPPNSSSSSSSGYHHGSGVLSPRSRLPCWSPLEPLPEIECGDDGYGRVPPDGAEEGRMQEGEKRVMMSQNEEKQREKMELQRRKSSLGFKGREEEEDMAALEDDDEWGDSDSDSDSERCRSGGSMSSLNEGEGTLMGGFDRIGVGEPKSNHQESEPPRNINREPPGRHRSFSRKSLTGRNLGNLLEEGAEDDERSSDSDGEMPELMDAVWTLRDRERFKAQEMEKHQVQLTMYRRLALIRWVRTLQGRIQEQQNRLQSSFDVILTQRKELLRMGAAAAVANATPAAAVSQA